MIFLTIGSHEPYDRLVRALDVWAGEKGHGKQIFGQITQHAAYKPRHFDYVANLSPADYNARCAQADLIVSHAGMGTILTALQTGTPALLLPRKGALGETRNDHQIATARKFEGRPGLRIVMDEADLGPTLDRVLGEAYETSERLPPVAQSRLTDALHDFIFRGRT